MNADLFQTHTLVQSFNFNIIMNFQHYDFGNPPPNIPPSPVTPTSTSHPQHHGHFFMGDNKPVAHPSTSNPITPPETPIDEEISRKDVRLSPTVYIAPTAPGIAIVGDSRYPVSQLQVMSEQVAQARMTGEFPQTSKLTMDAQSIVEDYRALLNLRATRGSLLTPAPEGYRQLHADIANHIKRRDASLNRVSRRNEVARRSSSYLRSVEQEQRFFEAANTMLQRRGITSPTQVDMDAIGDEICDIVEKSVDHMEQCVTDATRPLHKEVSNLRRQYQHNHATVERLSEAINASQALLGPQSTNLQTMTQNLNMASGLVGHLSQMIFDMPIMINQAVFQAVHHQAGTTIEERMQAQQEVTFPLHEQSQASTTRGTTHGLDMKDQDMHDKEIEAILAGQSTTRVSSPRRMTIRRSKLRRMMRKVLRRRG